MPRPRPQRHTPEANNQITLCGNKRGEGEQNTTHNPTLLELSHLSWDNVSTCDELVNMYNDGLYGLFDTFAPLKTRNVSFTCSSPWFTPELCLLKAKGCRQERLQAKTGLTVHKEMYLCHVLHYKDALSAAKDAYIASKISSGQGNTRALFSTVKSIIQSPDTLNPQMYTVSQCNAFMDFFTTKIQNLHQQLVSSSDTYSSPCPFPVTPVVFPLSTFQTPTISAISDLIRNSKSSMCQLDPLPTHLVKACLPSLSSFITAIIHSSLTSGLVPSPLKTAAITPILKKTGADSSNLHNFHPISNLPFLVKILEKTVATQVHAHLLLKQSV